MYIVVPKESGGLAFTHAELAADLVAAKVVSDTMTDISYPLTVTDVVIFKVEAIA